jgi:hypothetical protein
MNTQNLIRKCGATVLFLACAAGAKLFAADTPKREATNRDAIGSWFGRAIPVPGKTICPPGAPDCPVPLEIVMIFTIHGDGTFIGIDSNIFAGGNHSTAHGQWIPVDPKSIKAAFTLLQSSPNGVFIGGFKNLYQATLVDPDRMEGSIQAFLYSYSDAKGQVVVDSEGFPTPSPLAPPEQCDPSKGCVPLGQFSFKVRRVAAPEP